MSINYLKYIDNLGKHRFKVVEGSDFVLTDTLGLVPDFNLRSDLSFLSQSELRTLITDLKLYVENMDLKYDDSLLVGRITALEDVVADLSTYDDTVLIDRLSLLEGVVGGLIGYDDTLLVNRLIILEDIVGGLEGSIKSSFDLLNNKINNLSNHVGYVEPTMRDYRVSYDSTLDKIILNFYAYSNEFSIVFNRSGFIIKDFNIGLNTIELSKDLLGYVNNNYEVDYILLMIGDEQVGYFDSTLFISGPVVFTVTHLETLENVNNPLYVDLNITLNINLDYSYIMISGVRYDFNSLGEHTFLVEYVNYDDYNNTGIYIESFNNLDLPIYNYYFNYKVFGDSYLNDVFGSISYDTDKLNYSLSLLNINFTHIKIIYLDKGLNGLTLEFLFNDLIYDVNNDMYNLFLDSTSYIPYVNVFEDYSLLDTKLELYSDTLLLDGQRVTIHKNN